MKLVKLTMLAATAAIAAMAFIGASTASAVVHGELWLCKKAELLLCKDLVTDNGKMLATQVGTSTLSNAVVRECPKATAKFGEIVAKHYTHPEGISETLEALGFIECPGCEQIEAKTPQAFNLLMAEATGEVQLLDTLWSLSTKGMKIKFKGCFGMGVGCEYEGGSFSLPIEMTETEAYADVKSVEFKLIGSTNKFLCGETLKWTGKYRLEYTLASDGTKHTVWPTLLGEI